MADDFVDLVLGHGSQLSIWQMAARTLIIFLLALVMIRISGRRSLGQRSSFDVCMAVLLGAVLSRAVVGASPFLPTVGAGFALVILHRAIAWLSIRSPAFDRFVSGSERVLVEDGMFDAAEMRKALVSQRDLKEAMRKRFGADAPGHPLRAVLERDGAITLSKMRS
jgi:uncharacterized membrane protein YcaP (DUF421 family)